MHYNTRFEGLICRIIPPVLVMIGFGSTIWVVRLFYGPIKDLYSDLEYQRCQKNWWTTLLFINNHYNQHDMVCERNVFLICLKVYL